MNRAWFSEGVTTETSGSSAACTRSDEVDVVHHPAAVVPHQLWRPVEELALFEAPPDRGRDPPDRRVAEATGQPAAQRALQRTERPAAVAYQHGRGLAHVDVDCRRGLLGRLAAVHTQQRLHAPQGRVSVA